VLCLLFADSVEAKLYPAASKCLPLFQFMQKDNLGNQVITAKNFQSTN